MTNSPTLLSTVGTEGRGFLGIRVRLNPLILGHEILGRIAQIGEVAAKRYGVGIEPLLKHGS